MDGVNYSLEFFLESTYQLSLFSRECPYFDQNKKFKEWLLPCFPIFMQKYVYGKFKNVPIFFNFLSIFPISEVSGLAGMQHAHQQGFGSRAIVQI